MTTTETNNTLQFMVELLDVSKHYGSVRALQETNINIRKGEFLTLLGPSGSGKTTLLNLIAGTLSPTTGEVFIEGRNVTSVPAHKRGLGMVFQNYALMPHMTVFENIAFPLQLRKVSKKEIAQRVSAVLELIKLPDLAERKPRELSGGQQQRVAIARALVSEPSLLLADEPTGNLDTRSASEIMDVIETLNTQRGITTILVTHEHEVARRARRIIRFRDGLIEKDENVQ
mgnify:CR=1 FL=1